MFLSALPACFTGFTRVGVSPECMPGARRGQKKARMPWRGVNGGSAVAMLIAGNRTAVLRESSQGSKLEYVTRAGAAHYLRTRDRREGGHAGGKGQGQAFGKTAPGLPRLTSCGQVQGSGIRRAAARPRPQAPARGLRRRRRRSGRAWPSPLLAGSASRGPRPPAPSLCIREGGPCAPIGRAGPPRPRPSPGPDASTLGGPVEKPPAVGSGSRGERRARTFGRRLGGRRAAPLPPGGGGAGSVARNSAAGAALPPSPTPRRPAGRKLPGSASRPRDGDRRGDRGLFDGRELGERRRRRRRDEACASGA